MPPLLFRFFRMDEKDTSKRMTRRSRLTLLKHNRKAFLRREFFARGSESDLVVVSSMHGELSGELTKSRLKAAGIPAMIKFETYFNLYLGTFCPVDVVVPRGYANRARAIIGQDMNNLILSIPRSNKLTFIVMRLFCLLFYGV